ncbi:tRNA1(Val) (adenine(37)-N6)-methyltransferase [Eggerthia catenaformis]|uniref:tRNA1(Val) (adenine(37)-N6)-methyltransferase n=1 Tax=Eggerthia catenaformis TaxID=31973 RepID=UPI00248E68A9|nr:tRNA1(Val) (adenine(37)-N6)-methyltransferase [Eggerthia catenaformis]
MQEVINYLLAYNDLKIIQRKDMFNFSLDTVLLANFCSITKDVKDIVDFGTNNAAIPLLLSKRTNKPIRGIEVQKEAVEIALKNVSMNHLDHQISIIHDDIKKYVLKAPHTKLVLCNPPFFKVGEESHLNESEYLSIARHEIMIQLEEIIYSASSLLDFGGKLAMVHRPERMIEIIECMKRFHIEPKRLRFVYPKHCKEANVFLIEGVKEGRSGIKIESPLYAHNEDGSYSDEVRKYFGENIND